MNLTQIFLIPTWTDDQDSFGACCNLTKRIADKILAQIDSFEYQICIDLAI